MRSGWFLICGGLALAAGIVLVWFLAWRDVAGDPGAGHFLVPFTLGALMTLSVAVALVVLGALRIRRARHGS
jgi:membrane protein implicated in regulation of membrane protease activity